MSSFLPQRAVVQIFCSSFVALMAFGAWSSSAGEKIQIEGPERVELPSKSSPEDFMSQPFQLSPSRGSGASVPSVPPPDPKSMLRPGFRREKLEEPNWLFLPSQQVDQDKLIKEIFGVRDADAQARQSTFGRTNSGKAEAWEETLGDRWGNGLPDAPETQRDRNLNSFSGDRFNAPRGGRQNGSRSAWEDDWDSSSETISELNINSLLYPNQRPNPLNSLSTGYSHPFSRISNNNMGIMPGTGTPGTTIKKPDTERQGQAKEFDELLQKRTSYVDQLLSGTRVTGDATRQELNPVTGRRLDEGERLGSALGMDPLGEARTGFSPTPSRYTGIDSLQPRAPERAGGIAPLTPASSTPLMQPRPAVLPIPKRKY